MLHWEGSGLCSSPFSLQTKATCLSPLEVLGRLISFEPWLSCPGCNCLVSMVPCFLAGTVHTFVMGCVTEVPWCQGVGQLLASIAEGVVCLLRPELGSK